MHQRLVKVLQRLNHVLTHHISNKEKKTQANLCLHYDYIYIGIMYSIRKQTSLFRSISCLTHTHTHTKHTFNITQLEYWHKKKLNKKNIRS